MSNTLQDIPHSSSTTTTLQEPILHKLKIGLSKLIHWRRNSFVVDTLYLDSNNNNKNPSTRRDSFDSSDDDDSDTQFNSDLQHSIYSKDDDFERRRYNQASHSRRASAITIQTPPSILVKPSQHRHTKSLQNAHIAGHSRNTSHISFISSSNITVNSEDLTAKEFADMAGIKIVSDNEQVDNARDESSWSILSSGSTKSQSSTRIWDTGFWKKPEDGLTPPLRKHRSQHRQTLSLPPPLPPLTHGHHVTQGHHAKSKSNCDLPIVHELLHSVSNNQPNPPVIRKGRFEVQLKSDCSP